MNRSGLARRGEGVSALFDAFVFFVILLVASGALMMAVSNVSKASAEADSSNGLGRYASEVHSSALLCTVGKLNYSVNGSEKNLGRITVMETIVAIIDFRMSGSTGEISNLTEAVRLTYSLLTDERFHYAVVAEFDGHPSPFFISDSAESTARIGTVRWTSVVPMPFEGSDGTLTLYLWR